MKLFIRQLSDTRRLFSYKIFHSRTYSLLILQLFVNYINLKPLLEFSKAVQYPVSPWVFPFMISDYHYAFLFLVGFIYYFSDVPFLQHFNMYQVIRTGRIRWAAGHLCSIIVQSFFLMALNMGSGILLLAGHLEWTADWGKLLHTASLTNAASCYGFLFSIPSQTLEHFSPLQLMTITFLMGSLVISFFGILMFAVSLAANRLTAVTVGTIMTLMIFFVENVFPLHTVRMASITPADWIRTANIGLKLHGYYVLPSQSYMFTILVSGIALFGVIVLFCIRRVEFNWEKED